MTPHRPAAPRHLGAGPDVFPLALGCMGMSDLYGPASAVAGTRYDAHQMRILDSERPL